MRTEVIHKYYCEICGAEFDNKLLCEQHEDAEKLLLECRFWDDDRNRVDITDLDCSSNEVYYINIPSSRHADAVNYWLNDQGAYTIEYIQCGLYFYEEGMGWAHISVLRRALIQLEEMEREEN